MSPDKSSQTSTIEDWLFDLDRQISLLRNEKIDVLGEALRECEPGNHASRQALLEHLARETSAQLDQASRPEQRNDTAFTEILEAMSQNLKRLNERDRIAVSDRIQTWTTIGASVAAIVTGALVIRDRAEVGPIASASSPPIPSTTEWEGQASRLKWINLRQGQRVRLKGFPSETSGGEIAVFRGPVRFTTSTGRTCGHGELIRYKADPELTIVSAKLDVECQPTYSTTIDYVKIPGVDALEVINVIMDHIVAITKANRLTKAPLAGHYGVDVFFWGADEAECRGRPCTFNLSMDYSTVQQLVNANLAANR